jgi:prepilin-type N-terminal cleavage/methylation domain-containing protein
MNSKQNGFSLVEVLIATMVLTFGLLAMAASSGYVSAQLRSALYDTQRTHAKEQIVEELRASTYSGLATNSAGRTVGQFTMTWAVSQPTGISKLITLRTSGPGYRGSSKLGRTTVVDTMAFLVISP